MNNADIKEMLTMAYMKGIEFHDKITNPNFFAILTDEQLNQMKQEILEIHSWIK